MKNDFEIYGEGNPLVFLHAFPLNNRMWLGNIDLLIENGFQVILPNLFFESENKNALAETAARIGELIDSLQIERAVFAGLSMGGYVCFNLYRTRPEIFAGLILCDTNSSADTEEKRQSRFETIEKMKTGGNQVLVDSMLPNLVSEYAKEFNPNLFEELKEMIFKTDPTDNINALSAMAFRKNHDEMLERIKVPTALIFGAEDKITDLEIAEKMHGRIRSSELTVIPNAGHYANLEQPESFNRIVLKFAQSVKF